MDATGTQFIDNVASTTGSLAGSLFPFFIFFVSLFLSVLALSLILRAFKRLLR